MITGGGGDDDDTAGQIEVVLPASGAVLQSPWLYLSGTSHPRNTVTANGVPVLLRHQVSGEGAQHCPVGLLYLRVVVPGPIPVPWGQVHGPFQAQLPQ